MADNRTREKAQRQADFLEALGNVGSITQAAGAAGVGRTTVYEWRAEDPEFAAAWAEHFDKGIDALEAELIRRAFAGSDTAAIFILKGNKPEKYRERISQEVSGPGGKPIEVDDKTAADKLTAILGALSARAERDGSDLA